MINGKLSLLLLTSIFTAQVSAATIVPQNNDGVDEGFNDPNPPAHANQKGNNPGTTLGELRLNVLEEAARTWGDILNSNVTITIGVTFDDLSCFANSATLGSAGSTGSVANFSGLESDVAYHIALAESLNDSNLNGGNVEITARFNSKIDTNDPDCLGGGGFYYGLDGNAPDGTSALFPVVLHELGHGLGFASLTNSTTRAFFGAGGFPDVFSRNLHDLDTNKSWEEMSNGERQDSALNEPALVWQGAQVTADRAMYLGAAPELVINAPAGIAGTFAALLGEEPTIIIPNGGVTAGVIDGNDFGDGCGLINEASFSGKIILFDETNSCSAAFPAFFSEFVTSSVGVIIAATSGSGFPDMSGEISNQEITIPYVGVTEAVADDLRDNIGSVNVTIDLSPSKLNGENQGRVKMYAPAMLEEGSSVSHWSKTATPDLLMEPTLGMLEFADVDLTAAAFRDIGWSVNIPGEVEGLIFKDGFE